MNQYATHIPILTKIAEYTKGNIIELGCGNYSTPLLHTICEPQQRCLVSADRYIDWLNKFKYLETSWHKLVHVIKWADLSIIDTERWDVALVDHDQALRRRIEIERLMNNTKYIVVHDSENVAGFRWDLTFPKFKYRHDYIKLIPNTTVLSQTENLEFLSEI